MPVPEGPAHRGWLGVVTGIRFIQISTWGVVDAKIIFGHIAISRPISLGITAYCVKLNGENMWRYSNKTESVGLRKRPYYHCNE